mgnify:CR=1 FL=1
MTTFYLSPSSLSYRQYSKLMDAACSFGWSSAWVWPHSAFHSDALIDKQLIAKALTSFTKTDIFIAPVPGTPSTLIEIGAAYALCEDVLLFSKDPVYFTQCGINDAYMAAMPGIKRICCDLDEIPVRLQYEYLHLIKDL